MYDINNEIVALLVRLSLVIKAGAGPAEERGGGQGQGEKEEQPGRQVVKFYLTHIKDNKARDLRPKIFFIRAPLSV